MERTIYLFWGIGFLGNSWMMSIGLGIATQSDWVEAYESLINLLDLIVLLLERLAYELIRLLHILTS